MRHFLMLSLLVVGACDSGKSTPAPSSPTPASVSTPATPTPPAGAREASIGTARMRDDGTIVMKLRALGPGGAVGDAEVTYAPTSPQYRDVLAHLGGLQRGEEKPVLPWPDEAPRR